MSRLPRSPWLDIPLADYEGHMSWPTIAQADMLATQFGELLADWLPTSAAVIGCAGGNGFDRVRVLVTKRLVGIDINPQYIQELAYRHAASIPGLELYVRDVQEPIAGIEPVELIYAALVLEYVEPDLALRNLAAICRPHGIMAIVVQLPFGHDSPVSESPFISLKGLTPAMHLVSPEWLMACASDIGLSPRSSRKIALPSGRQFALQVYQYLDPSAA